jgi:hypothetical protein
MNLKLTKLKISKIIRYLKIIIKPFVSKYIELFHNLRL